MITGLNHLTLSVSDLQQSFDFYTQVLGCQPIALWNRGAYLLAGDLWLCLSLDRNTRTSPSEEYTHVAFSVAGENFKTYCDRLINLGVKSWQANTSEGDSFYLLDPDGHKLELHVGNWRSRIQATKKAPYANMEFFDGPKAYQHS